MERKDHLTLQKGNPEANIRMGRTTEKTMADYFDKYCMLKIALKKEII